MVFNPDPFKSFSTQFGWLSKCVCVCVCVCVCWVCAFVIIHDCPTAYILITYIDAWRRETFSDSKRKSSTLMQNTPSTRPRQNTALHTSARIQMPVLLSEKWAGRKPKRGIENLLLQALLWSVVSRENSVFFPIRLIKVWRVQETFSFFQSGPMPTIKSDSWGMREREQWLFSVAHISLRTVICLHTHTHNKERKTIQHCPSKVPSTIRNVQHTG